MSRQAGGPQSTRLVREQFANRAGEYDQYTRWGEDGRLNREICRPLADVAEDARCLDLGAGTSSFSQRLGVPGRWLSVDVSMDMLRQGESAARVQGDAHSLPFSDASVDVVLARSVLSYVDGSAVLSEIARILRKDGFLVIAEKVLGSYADTASWYGSIQSIRNPLKSAPVELHQLVGQLRACGFSVGSALELERRYTYTYEDWLSRSGTIPLATQDRIREMIARAPEQLEAIRPKVHGDHLEMTLYWAVLYAKRREAPKARSPLIATVAPVRLESRQLSVYMQHRVAPVYREPQFVGLWEFPQGHVEQGETILQAASRELAEEAGLRIERAVDWTAETETSHHVDLESVANVGVIRAGGQLDYLATWLVAEVSAYPGGAGALDHRGEWLTLPKLESLVERGVIYPLNLPMVRCLLESAPAIQDSLSRRGGSRT